MAANMVKDIFKHKFAKFLAKNGFNWHNDFFAKYENGIFIRVYSEFVQNSNGYFIDVICQPVPTFCKIGKINNRDKNIELSVARIITYKKSVAKITDKLTEQAVTELMEKYAAVFTENYEKMFRYNSVTDYAEKVTDYFTYVTNNFDIERMAYFKYNIKYLNFNELAYIWYRTGKQEKCKKVIFELINVCKSFLEERSQLMYVIDDDENKRKINEEIAQVGNSYKSLVQFAEALFEENKNYFDELDRMYNRTEVQSISYISSLVAG